MAAEPVIEPILEHVAPDLRLVPDWAPQPDPYQIAPGFGIHATWGDVWNWVTKTTGDILPHGKTITDPFFEQSKQYTDTVAGQTLKALSGYIEQSAAMTVQAAQLLETSIDNVYANQLHDYQDLSTRIDAAVAYQQAIVGFIVPVIEQQIQQAEARAYTYALAGQQNAENWGLQNIFAPLQYELGTIQPKIDAGVAKAEDVAHSDAKSQVTILGAAVGAAFNPVRDAVRALQQESEDCTQPMCETMGPKTDLGKLLKGLKLAADAALLAELAGMDEAKLVALLKSIAGRASSLISLLDSTFFEGGATVAETITKAIS